MIDKALAWEQTRILPTGEIGSEGNTRTAGQERRRNGKVKTVSYNSAIRGFAYWGSVTNNPQWAAIALDIAHYYYKLRRSSFDRKNGTKPYLLEVESKEYYSFPKDYP